jgi:hypothetical protein
LIENPAGSVSEAPLRGLVASPAGAWDWGSERRRSGPLGVLADVLVGARLRVGEKPRRSQPEIRGNAAVAVAGEDGSW